jgi:hypothetical protein
MNGASRLHKWAKKFTVCSIMISLISPSYSLLLNFVCSACLARGITLLPGAEFFATCTSLDSPDNSYILYNPYVHYHTYNSLVIPLPRSWFIFNIHVNVVPTTSRVSRFSFLQVSPAETWMFSSPPSCVLHAPHISFCLFDHPNNIWWGLQRIKLFITEFFSAPMLPHRSYTQIFSSAPYSRTHSGCVLPAVRETRFHTHIKEQNVMVLLLVTVPVIIIYLVWEVAGRRSQFSAVKKQDGGVAVLSVIWVICITDSWQRRPTQTARTVQWVTTGSELAVGVAAVRLTGHASWWSLCELGRTCCAVSGLNEKFWGDVFCDHAIILQITRSAEGCIYCAGLAAERESSS